MSQFAASVICTTLLVATSLAQTPDWTQVTPANSPAARRDHADILRDARAELARLAGDREQCVGLQVSCRHGLESCHRQ